MKIVDFCLASFNSSSKQVTTFFKILHIMCAYETETFKSENYYTIYLQTDVSLVAVCHVS